MLLLDTYVWQRNRLSRLCAFTVLFCKYFVSIQLSPYLNFCVNAKAFADSNIRLATNLNAYMNLIRSLSRVVKWNKTETIDVICENVSL